MPIICLSAIVRASEPWKRAAKPDSISFAGTLTFKRNTALRELATTLPAERVMVETDCPYMSPEPRRDTRRCEPAFVLHTAEVLAAARHVPLEEVAVSLKLMS